MVHQLLLHLFIIIIVLIVLLFFFSFILGTSRLILYSIRKNFMEYFLLMSHLFNSNPVNMKIFFSENILIIFIFDHLVNWTRFYKITFIICTRIKCWSYRWYSRSHRCSGTNSSMHQFMSQSTRDLQPIASPPKSAIRIGIWPFIEKKMLIKVKNMLKMKKMILLNKWLMSRNRIWSHRRTTGKYREAIKGFKKFY